MHSLIKAGIVTLTFAVATPLAAQSHPAHAGDAEAIVAATTSPAGLALPAQTAADSIFAAGASEGATIARTVGTGVWTIGGFVGSAVLGPVGAGLSYVLADGAASPLPAETASKIARRDAGFKRGYQDAFSAGVAQRRKSAALLGGIAGSAVFIAGGTYLLFIR